MCNEINRKVSETYYFPLTVTVFAYDRYGGMEEVDEQDGRFAADYADEIACALEDCLSVDPNDMAEYFDGSPSAQEKIRSLEWGFETVGGLLFGRVTATLSAPLTEPEEADLKDFILGQNSDGLGEGFEQQDIEVGEWVLNVHLWNDSGEYEVLNADEFCMLHPSSGFAMGGPV